MRRRLSESACQTTDAVTLNTPEVLELVDETVSLTLPAGTGASFAKFVEVGEDCCTGAAAADPTHGGLLTIEDGVELSVGSTLVNLQRGYHKVCIALDNAAPYRDDDFALLDTAVLTATVTRPPPPPPSSPPPRPPSPPPPCIPPSVPPLPPPRSPPNNPPYFTETGGSLDACVVNLGQDCLSFSGLIAIVVVFITLLACCFCARPVLRFVKKYRCYPGAIIDMAIGTRTIIANRPAGSAKGAQGDPPQVRALKFFRAHPIALVITGVVLVAAIGGGIALAIVLSPSSSDNGSGEPSSGPGSGETEQGSGFNTTAT